MNKCELLVPAGGEQQFIAAVENGADAVYIGGKKFNARINAANFSNDEIKRAAAFAHKRGVKVYVTMNTLITDDEMKDAINYAGFLYEAGVDALIIQDAGFGMLLKESIPDFPLHLSTQGSVYDLRGVEAAYRMGYERIVLARELSMKEISEICRNTDAEIEVFVHGAMCICYSGQCQMSRIFGGRSGNRGECAQPCRLPYKSFDSNNRLIESFKYPLSPKDLCMIDHIGEFVDAGVCSMKIEGRMKNAEYVAVVTSIYRKYLDLYYRNGNYSVQPEDRKALEQIFNRGGFTEGYYEGNPGEKLMSGNIPKHRGIRIGKVVKKIQGTTLVDVKLYDSLSIGDGVEIQGRNVTGNVVTYYKELKSGLTRIGDIKGEVQHGDILYRITRKAQLEEAGRIYKKKSFEEGKFIRKRPVSMDFTCSDDGRISLVVKINDSDIKVCVKGDIFPYAESAFTEYHRIDKALRKTGNTPFLADTVKCSDITGRTIPISSINNLRRKALSQLEKQFEKGRNSVVLPDYTYIRPENHDSQLEFFFYSWENYKNFMMDEKFKILDIDNIMLLPVVDFEKHYEELEHEQRIVPYITSISKGKENNFIEQHFDSICNHCRETGIYVGNLSWIMPFRSEGVPVYGDSGLNVYNHFSEEAYASLGVRFCADSMECAEEGMGNLPLMISEHCPDGKWLLDRKKKKVEILRRDFSDQIIIKEMNQNPDINLITERLKQRRIVRVYI